MYESRKILRDGGNLRRFAEGFSAGWMRRLVRGFERLCSISIVDLLTEIEMGLVCDNVLSIKCVILYNAFDFEFM